MNFFHLFSGLIVLSAAFAYINYRFVKLPNSIGLMLVSIVFSLFVLLSGSLFPHFQEDLLRGVRAIDFSDLLLEGMLSFMLFAGAIHIRFSDLHSERLSVLLYSTLSVIISTIFTGFATYYLLNALGVEVALIHSLLFGALISPTDPIAVLSILKRAGISKSLETKIAGESLFNDGVAVVVFLSIAQLASPDVEISVRSISMLFLHEAGGGVMLGLVAGWIGYRLIASIDHYQVEVLITIAVVMGSYSLASNIHISGPLAVVVAGLIIGNSGKDYGMSALTTEYVDKFWELIDEILNSLLFVLIGLELLIVKTNPQILIAGSVLIIIVLFIRYISILIPSLMIRFREKITQRTIFILTWGGLRGGISIALALSIPTDFNKDIWVTITYIIVCFSILVQGLSIGRLARHTAAKAS